MKQRLYQTGSISGSMIVITILVVVLMGVAAVAIWAYINYDEAQTDLDGKLEMARIEARKEEAAKNEADFIKREKEPNRQFVGPDDYGRVTFDYPKTWSVYVKDDVSSGRGTYEAYLNPVLVPPVSNKQRMAIRVTIENRDYDTVLKSYESRIKKGDLKSAAFSADGVDGSRLTGGFTNDIRGSAVLFKIRDKTLTIRTDADTFMEDYDKLIDTIQFNR